MPNTEAMLDAFKRAEVVDIFGPNPDGTITIADPRNGEVICYAASVVVTCPPIVDGKQRLVADITVKLDGGGFVDRPRVTVASMGWLCGDFDRDGALNHNPETCVNCKPQHRDEDDHPRSNQDDDNGRKTD